MIPGSANPLLLATAAAGGYSISRSVRFNSSDSAYLSRTPASAGNRKTWTWAGWVKRCKLGTYQTIISAGNSSPSQRGGIRFPTGDTLEITEDSSGYTLATTQVFRDVSAWYHLVVAFDSTQATSSNRIKLYVNGTQVSTFSTATYPSQNFDSVFSTTDPHRIGELSYAGNIYELDAYLADLHFCDGTAYDASAFGEFDANGIWQPKKFTGVYGSQGWHLDFSDNSTAAALGTDTSGNGNTWTVNNLSVTAGAGNDSLVDVPVNGSEVDTGLGNQVRGNYCTLNPLDGNPNLGWTNGNLDVPAPSNTWRTGSSTIGVISGKWYWEVLHTGTPGGNQGVVGIVKQGYGSGQLGGDNSGYGYYTTGEKTGTGTNFPYGASWTTNDIIGVAFDADNGTLTFYKNNVSQGVAWTGITSGPWMPAVSVYAISLSYNFGARSFAYQAPSGFKALNTASLPAPVITKPNTVMDVVLYTGTGSSLTLPYASSTPTSIAFTPDLVWIKGRSGATDHALYDAVRDVQKDLASNSTAAETTQSTGLTAFGTNTFTIGSLAKLNTSSATYAAWCWDAGTSTVTNTAGSISSQVRANASAGFSIVTYTGNGSSAQTVGHGLGVAPSLVIVKKRSATDGWLTYFTGFSSNEYLYLNSTDAKASFSGTWGSTPTSTVFGVGDAVVNANGATFVAYCWSPVAGYSSFGSYTGNGQTGTSGPFIYCGFRPRYVLIKKSSSADNWKIFDSVRDSYNVTEKTLQADLANAELVEAYNKIDILSNGFAIRVTNASFGLNTNDTFIWAAFAESPFQYARAR